MRIIDAFKLVKQEKGIVVIRNPITKGQKCIEFIGVRE